MRRRQKVTQTIWTDQETTNYENIYKGKSTIVIMLRCHGSVSPCELMKNNNVRVNHYSPYPQAGKFLRQWNYKLAHNQITINFGATNYYLNMNDYWHRELKELYHTTGAENMKGDHSTKIKPKINTGLNKPFFPNHFKISQQYLETETVESDDLHPDQTDMTIMEEMINVYRKFDDSDYESISFVNKFRNMIKDKHYWFGDPVRPMDGIYVLYMDNVKDKFGKPIPNWRGDKSLFKIFKEYDSEYVMLNFNDETKEDDPHQNGQMTSQEIVDRLCGYKALDRTYGRTFGWRC